MTRVIVERSPVGKVGHENFVNSHGNSSAAVSSKATTRATEQPKERSGRGLKPTGKALSAAERQARRLVKLETEGKGLLPPAVVSAEVKQALAMFIQFKDMTLGDALDRIVRGRLLRKRSARHKSRAKRPAVSQPINQARLERS